MLVQKLQQIRQLSLDVLFPPQCTGCKRTGSILCETCKAAIVPVRLPICQRCGVPSLVAEVCQYCQYHPPRLSGLRIVSGYEGILRTCIHALKYEGNVRLAEPLGQLLAEAYRYYSMQVDVIMAVPLHAERQKARGYNHASLLADVCARQVLAPHYDNIVMRHRATSAQVGLSARERQQNVVDAFCCAPMFTTGILYGKSILIIDDVATTGATLEACAAPLFAAGAKAVWGLVLARTV